MTEEEEQLMREFLDMMFQVCDTKEEVHKQMKLYRKELKQEKGLHD